MLLYGRHSLSCKKISNRVNELPKIFAELEPIIKISVFRYSLLQLLGQFLSP